MLSVAGREVRHERPVLYQLPGGDPVHGSFRLDADGTVGFDVGPWDRTRTLVIDPVLVFGTYVRGSGADRANAVAVDGSGNIYVAGTTASTDFPIVGGVQPAFGGNTDAFVTKINAAGTAVVYSTYLGGGGLLGERGLAIAVGADGSAFVGGEAFPGFPTTASPLNSCTSTAGFVTKLAPAGDALTYSICFAAGTERVNGIAVDGAGNAYITGLTNGGDASIRRLNGTGTAWTYSLSLAGNGSDEGFGIAVDAAGNACVTGRTGSSNFPVVNAIQPTTSALIGTAFTAKYTPSGSPVFVTYLGGSLSESGYGAAIDGAGQCYVAGMTLSDNFPVASAAQPAYRGRGDGFVTVYSANGSAYVYSSYLGGSRADAAYDIAVSPTGAAPASSCASASSTESRPWFTRARGATG